MPARGSAAEAQPAAPAPTRTQPIGAHEAGDSDTISLLDPAKFSSDIAAKFSSDIPAEGVTMTDVSASDFAVVVYREDDVWEAEVLPTALTENLDGLIQALRQQPGIGGAIGLAAVGDDFFVALRVLGNHVSVFLSDVTASVDWPLARQVLDYLDIPVPEDEDLDQVLPVGDMSIFADLGVDEMELGALSGDLDLFPDEVLASLARRIGFGQALERALDSAIGAL